MLFTVADAQASGISRGVLRGTQYRRVLGSVYVDGKVPVTPRLQAEAALLLTPEAVASHQTALSLWTANDHPDDVVHVTVQRDPHRNLPRVNGLRVHEVQHLDRAVRDGLPLTPPERTFLDLAPPGGWLAKPDLSYPQIKLAIEYDGRHHLVDARQWRQDIRRRENLEREGWLVRVFTAYDVLNIPHTVVACIAEDLHTRHHPRLAA
ncbi:DUF559 domain-containing protein [Kribbella sindirgiensis]|uniref:DUF559 domain-containing protein n=1 Tax=Kribbella sindirgiensis TaxID=1124744 RepID=UPI0013F41B09|nr:DUF559 domain-containing protein [Kribbella sindirgiensis]